MEKSNSKRVLSGVFGSGSSPSRWENNNEDIRLSSTSRLDEEALQWAAIERLPTNNRARAAIYNNYDEGGRPVRGDVVDVAHLNDLQRHLLIEKLIQDAQTDNEIFLKKLRRRIDRVGIRLPTVEVRFQGLHVQALCHFGTRALPTLLNTVLNILEGGVECFGLKSSKKEKLDILDNASGIIRPGRITLLLGPPSCGKTTLLLALAGKLSPNLKTSGSISYNGYELHEFVPQKTSAYISQHDEHIAEMTVRETLDFSARCLGVGVKHDLVTEILRREKEAGILPEADIDTFMKATAIEGLKGNLQTDYILKILGLDICANTIVGNGMIRGVSGGQRKRVTTGEMIVSPMKTLFMDEISTGLDSSTTYQIVKCHRQFAHLMEATIVMSLLQPAPETFSLFDDIVLLSNGKIIYNGPRENVLEFFEFCGFKCPERKGTADFLQEVISKKDQEQYWSDKKKPYSYISSEQFSWKFKEFHIGQKLSEELSHPFDKSQNHKAALSFRKYSLDKWQLFKACFNREWLLMKRNSFVYIFKAIQLVVIAFITMTVFLRTHMKVDVVHGNYFLGSLFFSLMVMMFIGQAELVLAISRLPVFFKQRDLFFYPAWAYALPGFLLKIPLSLFDSLIWTVVTYYTIGYSPEPSRFFRQLFVFFAMHQMATSLFRVAAGICRSMVVANTGGSIGIVIVLYLGGFLIPRASIPVWWRWAYWISPLSYAESAITVNEFLAPRWMTPTFQNISLGIEVLENRGLFHDDKFYWIGVISLLGFVLLFNFIYILSLTYLNPIGKRQALISQEKLTQKNEIKDDAISKHTNGSTTGLDHQSQESRKGIASTDKAQLSILEDDMQEPVKASGATKGMLLTFQPLSIAFRNIQYFVDMPPAMRKQGVMEKKLHLLKDVTGAFRPGVLTALMGVSGAGKTTLMDVLAGRKTGGYIEGDIMIGGFPKVQETFTRVSGYCEQNDIHSPQVTVHESLLFSAWLRLGNDRDSKTKKIFVSEVMQLVELDVLKDMLVGIPGISGLSTEQRKRLTIAVELVANPSIIFMDEPTSGLDARAAAIVMRAVRNTVDTGRTVVCTIHQPSIEIFESFDELLLMKRGGQIIYAGELGHQSEKIVKYFEAIAGVPKIRDDINPAAWMLEVSSIAAEQRLGIDFARLYTESSLCNKNMELVKELSIPAPGANKVDFPTKYARSPWKQFTCCLWKLYWAHWRSPGYNLVRFTYTFICAFIFGTIYWQQGTKIHSQKDLLKVLGAMYGGALFLGINNCSSVQAFVDVERMVFYREKGAGMYFPFAFALAQIVAELPYTFFQTIMFVAITYPMIGYYWSLFKFLWYTYITFCSLLYFTYYGMLSVAISPNAQIAAIMSAAFFSLFNLFSGFLITQPQIPRWWVWYYWICPTAWTLDGFITAQYGDVTKSIITQRGLKKSIQQFSKDYFGFHKDFMPVVAVVLAIFPAFFALLFVVTISKLNFQKR